MPAPSSQKWRGPAIRMGILVAVLGLAGFAFYNDMRLAAEIDLLSDQFFRLEEAADSTYTPEKVQAELKRKPDRTYQTGKYEVEEYKLRRTIPFLSFGSMYAIYENGSLFKVSQGSQPTVQSIEKASDAGPPVQKQKQDSLN